MKFSIILPIYNVEKYLEQCVNSILAQTFKDFEVILVDDGSPDGSPQICAKYAASHTQIKVIHKPNGGLSSARNAGERQAEGYYIIFCDSDDYWDDKDALAHVNRQIEEYGNDVVIWGLKYRDERTGYIGSSRLNKRPYDTAFVNNHPANDVVNQLEAARQYPGAAWLMAVKHSLISEHGIHFIEGNVGEDYDWVAKVLSHAQSIGCINECFYIYRINRTGSITTQTVSPSKIKGMMDAVSNWMKVATPAYIGITRYLSKTYTLALRGYIGLDKDGRRAFIEAYRQNSSILKASRKPVYLALYLLIKVIGIKATSRMAGLMYKLLTLLRDH